MSRRWMGVALLVGSLAVAADARAQAPVPEPIPCGPSLAPPGSPPVPPYAGPLPAQAAPHGPPDCMVLPADIPGAFTDCPPEPACGTYFHIGGISLQRQRLDNGPVASIDTVNTSNLKNGIPPAAERDLATVLDYKDLSPPWGTGIAGTLGYLWGGNALEVTGFYVFNQGNTDQVGLPGRLFLPFHNPPLGFEGDNGMWLHADVARIRLDDAIGVGEFNYRWTTQAFNSVEGIIGFRYTDQQEQLDIYTGDDDLTVRNLNGQPDPTREAIYKVFTHNHLFAPQFGFEWHTPICSYIDLTVLGKGAWGINYVDEHLVLTRGDGLVGRSTPRFHTGFAHTYDAGFFLDFWFLERGRIRAGYNLLLLCNVVDAQGEVNYDLAHQASQPIHEGTMFYHGPMVELELLF
jgi:hypothetical protein